MNGTLGSDSSTERFLALIQASAQVLYRMNPDWSEMRQLGGGGFLSDTTEPNCHWLQDYIPKEDHALLSETIANAIRDKSVFDLEHRVCQVDGSVGWTHSRAVPIFGNGGEILEWFGAASNITARKNGEVALRTALAERESLLKETHHRVKNNLQVITSLLEMQARQISDPKALDVFGEARNRVSSIAAIHEYLYRSDSLNRIDLVVYSRELIDHLIWFYRLQDRLESHVVGDGIVLDLDRGVSFGLLLNELVSNVCKHAFPGDARGKLTVQMRKSENRIDLEVSDTGTGLPMDFEQRTASSLGISLVHTLAEQLKGAVTFHSGEGTTARVFIPLDEKEVL